MELIGIQQDKKGNLSFIKPKTLRLELFPDEVSPEIILTKEEVKNKKLGHLVPKKLGFRDILFNKGRKCVGYVVIEGVRVPILLKEDKVD